MSIFIEVVFPVVFVFFIGFLIQKWHRVDIRSLTTVAIYVLTPCLVFQTFYETELDLNYLFMVAFSLLLLMSLIVINKIYVKIRKEKQSMESALILSTAFMNSGNFGAPLILFAYGEAGFAYSVSFMVLQAIIMNFFGVYYAARGKATMLVALKSVFKMPATYAVLLALSMNVYEIEMPSNVLLTVDLIAMATIPVVMLILGMQLAKIEWTGFQWPKVIYASITRLMVSPVLAYLIIVVFPMSIDPLLQKVLIVSAAMPSAATTTIYAVQFNAEPKLVSSITLITTVISIGTITLMLTFLG